MGTPVQTSCIAYWENDEDIAAVAPAPWYQSYALTYTSIATALPFANLSSSVVEVGEDDAGIELGRDTGSSGGYKAVAATAPVAASSMDRSTNLTEDPVTSLMDSLRSSADPRATVRAWAASTATRQVYDLSPENLQRVLQGVSISSDQLVVAGELAQAIRCTCAHVTAALAVCQFFKTEVALAMVPHVRDAEHKAQVLNLLPSYDQKKVEGLFV